MPWLRIIIVLSFAIAAIGIALLVRGWRGRQIDDHPLCSGCGYDLVGSDDQTRVCPECGNDLARLGALRIGHRRRRPFAITFGVLLLALAMGGGGAMLVPGVRQFDWNPYKPLWLLQRQSDDANLLKARAAQREILARLSDGRLSASQIDRMIRSTLVLQADPALPWNHWRGDFVEQAWREGKVGDEVIIQYGRTAAELSFSLGIPQRFRRGTMVMSRVNYSSIRAGSTGALLMDIAYGNVLLEDGSIFVGGSGRTRTRLAIGSRVSSGSGSIVDLPVGRYTAKATGTVRLLRSDRAAGQFGLNRNDDDATLIVFPLEVSASFEVVSDQTQIVELVRDASLAIDMHNAVAAGVQATMLGGGRVLLSMQVDARRVPMNAAFDVFVRAGDREWSLDQPIAIEREDAPDDGMLTTGIAPQWIAGELPADIDRVDVILRPSVPAAEVAGLSRIWGEEVVVKDVPVRRSD